MNEFINGLGVYQKVPFSTLCDLNSIGVRGVRGWYTIDWNRTPQASEFDTYRVYKHLGWATTIVVTPPENVDPVKLTTDLPNAHRYFKALAQAVAGAVDVVEVINEVNLKSYWPAAIDYAVDDVLVPASWELRQAGVKVGSPSWSGNPGENTKYGAFHKLWQKIKSMVDVVCHHPYGPTVSEHEKRLVAMRAIVGPDVPIWLTEWNIHGRWSGMNDATWAAELPKAHAVAKKYAQAAFYFQLLKNNSAAGLAGLYVDQALTQRTVFFDSLKQCYS